MENAHRLFLFSVAKELSRLLDTDIALPFRDVTEASILADYEAGENASDVALRLADESGW